MERFLGFEAILWGGGGERLLDTGRLLEGNVLYKLYTSGGRLLDTRRLFESGVY